MTSWRASSSNMGSSKNLLMETSSDKPYNNGERTLRRYRKGTNFRGVNFSHWGKQRQCLIFTGVKRMPAFFTWLIMHGCGNRKREVNKAPGKGLLHAVPLSCLRGEGWQLHRATSIIRRSQHDTKQALWAEICPPGKPYFIQFSSGLYSDIILQGYEPSIKRF